MLLRTSSFSTLLLLLFSVSVSGTPKLGLPKWQSEVTLERSRFHMGPHLISCQAPSVLPSNTFYPYCCYLDLGPHHRSLDWWNSLLTGFPVLACSLQCVVHTADKLICFIFIKWRFDNASPSLAPIALGSLSLEDHYLKGFSVMKIMKTRRQEAGNLLPRLLGQVRIGEEDLQVTDFQPI